MSPYFIHEAEKKYMYKEGRNTAAFVKKFSHNYVKANLLSDVRACFRTGKSRAGKA